MHSAVRIALTVLSLAALPAVAQVYTCTSSTGTREFTDRPCDPLRPSGQGMTFETAEFLAALRESPPRLEWPYVPGTVADGSSWQPTGKRSGYWVPAGTAVLLPHRHGQRGRR